MARAHPKPSILAFLVLSSVLTPLRHALADVAPNAATGVSASTGAQGAKESAPAPSGQEDIVVTSRRRSEKLKDVPLAVSVLTAKQLKTLDIESTQDLSNYVPGLTAQNFTAGGYNTNARAQTRAITFRGLNLANNYGITAASLVFLDGAPIIGSELPYGIDVQRVEVIRGPQAVYFGRSTLGGAVNYVTATPTDTWHGTLNTKFGSYGTRDYDATVKGPIIADKLSVGLSASQDSNDGYYKNNFDDSKLGAQRTRSFAGTVDATPVDGLSIKGFVNYFEDYDGPSATAQLSSLANNCSVGGIRSYYCGSFPPIGNLGFYSPGYLTPAAKGALFSSGLFPSNEWDRRLGLQRKAIDAHVVTSYDLPFGITISNLWSYERDRSINALDSSNEPYVPGNLYKYYVATLGYDVSDFDEELRLSSSASDRLRWTVGANYLHGTIAQQSVADYVVNGVPGEGQYIGAVNTQLSSSYGVFGGLYYDIIKNLTLSLEGRNQWDDRTDYSTGGPSLSKTFESFSPRLSLEYKLTPNISTYVSYARGTRPGGFNADLLPYIHNTAVLSQVASQLGSNTTAYNEEQLSTWEYGVKGDFFSHRVSLNSDLYYGKLRNQQVSNIAFIPALNNSLAVTGNVGQTRIYGFEADGSWTVNRLLTFSGSFSWNHVSVISYLCVACEAVIGTSDVNGNNLGNAPTFSGSLAADLHDQIGKTRWNWFAHADYVYRGPEYLDVNDAGLLHSRSIINLRGGVARKNLSLETYVTNLTNDRHYSGGSQGEDFATGSYTAFDFGVPPPRMFGVRVGVGF